MNMTIKPTIREVKVALKSAGVDQPVRRHYNDQRANGGRIKFYVDNDISDDKLKNTFNILSKLFPNHSLKLMKYRTYPSMRYRTNPDGTNYVTSYILKYTS